MAERFYAALDARGVLEVAGEDRASFLQGLVSNDVARVAPDRAIYAALLTAQGKFLFDFTIISLGDVLYLDTEAERVGELKRRLGVYKLRSKVTLAGASDRFAVSVAFGPGAAATFGLAEMPGAAASIAGGIAYVDPRLADLGVRLLLPRGAETAVLDDLGFTRTEAAAYDRLRLALGVPDGSRDLPVDKAILLEAGFDELNGVDWQKGCYMGQELTARTKYRALIKKRLLPVRVDGPLPAPGTLVMQGDREAGEIRSGRDGTALALLRLEALDADEPMTAGEAKVMPSKPGWVRI
jgi:folate-binding protein YgfZ